MLPLIVPENSNPKVKRILVPSDFSDYSKDALEEAIEITEKMEVNRKSCAKMYIQSHQVTILQGKPMKSSVPLCSSMPKSIIKIYPED